MNLHTVKWSQCDKLNPENYKNCSSKCASDCAQLQYTVQVSRKQIANFIFCINNKSLNVLTFSEKVK